MNKILMLVLIAQMLLLTNCKRIDVDLNSEVKSQGSMAEEIIGPNVTLRISNMTKTVRGKTVDHALAINGGIPAPTLKFKLGQKAVIKVFNDTDEPTSLHWHGLLVPWRQDGPQFANTKLIKPRSSHTFEFDIIQTGTYWYHSHTEFQEQRGLYGAIVIEDETPKYEVDHDLVFVMSDWTNEDPKQVMANLKKDGDFYKFKKDFVASLLGAIRHGVVWNFIKSHWSPMGPMDLSDVYYDAFFINGEINSKLKNVKHGEKIRFRVINASASSYFYFNIGNLQDFTVISKDGVEVQPVKVNELIVAIAETYDVIFEMPHSMKKFEARATAQDVTGHASLEFGMGELESVPDKMKPLPYGMNMDHDEMDHGDMDPGGEDDHTGHDGHTGGDDDGLDPIDTDDGLDPMDNGNMDHGDMGGMSHVNLLARLETDIRMETVLRDVTSPEHAMPMKMTKRLNYKMLKSVTPTKFKKKYTRAQVIELKLSGNMERYTWYINDKPFSEKKYIEISKNEVITFKFTNTTMMHHPMHLHGHFFRALMGQGDFAPLFHTIDVGPMKTVSIEFLADKPGIWFLHCHNLYHMKMGMARLIKYKGFKQPQVLAEEEAKWSSEFTHDDGVFYSAEVTAFSNQAALDIELKSGRYELTLELEVDDYDIKNLEAEVILRRYLGNFLSMGLGVGYEDEKVYGLITAAYRHNEYVTLETDVRSDGKVLMRLKTQFQFSNGISVEFEPEVSYGDMFEWEIKTGVYYRVNNTFKFGVTYTKRTDGEHSAGVGIKINF